MLQATHNNTFGQKISHFHGSGNGNIQIPYEMEMFLDFRSLIIQVTLSGDHRERELGDLVAERPDLQSIDDLIPPR